MSSACSLTVRNKITAGPICFCSRVIVVLPLRFRSCSRRPVVRHCFRRADSKSRKSSATATSISRRKSCRSFAAIASPATARPRPRATWSSNRRRRFSKGAAKGRRSSPAKARRACCSSWRAKQKEPLHAAARQRREGQAAHAAGAGPDQAVDRSGSEGRGEGGAARRSPGSRCRRESIRFTPSRSRRTASMPPRRGPIRFFSFHVPSKRELGRLTDPALLSRRHLSSSRAWPISTWSSRSSSAPTARCSPPAAFARSSCGGKPDGGAGSPTCQRPMQHDRTCGRERLNSCVAQIGEQSGELESDRPAKKLKTLNHGSPVAAFAVSPDGKRLASAGADRQRQAVGRRNRQADRRAEGRHCGPRLKVGEAHPRRGAGQEAHRAGEEGPGRRQRPQKGRGRKQDEVGRGPDEGRDRAQAQGRSGQEGRRGERRPPRSCSPTRPRPRPRPKKRKKLDRGAARQGG